MANKTLKKSTFLSAYKLDESYALKPSRDTARPGIIGGYAPDGNPILVKHWRRTPGSKDDDLKEIWRHEIRQLHRLAGYPGTTECIAHLYDAGFDEHGFYLLLAAGLRRPLASMLHTVPPGHWILTPTVPSSRVQIWSNLALLAIGLETLHSQGLLHRNIDTWAVLTAGTDEPDFQLTGFEWSMRVVGAEAKLASIRRARIARVKDSFLRDWLMYGVLAAELLGAKPERLLDSTIASHQVADHLSAEEVILLRNVTQVLPSNAVNGEMVASRIGQLVQTLAAQVAHRSPKFHLALRLGRGSPLGDRIRKASDNEIETDDAEEQLAFVVSDLNSAPMLIAVKPWQPNDGVRLLLRGKHLLYSLQKFPPEKGPPTWEFAYCENAEKFAPAAPHMIGSAVLDSGSLDILPLHAARGQFPRSRGRLRSWDEWRRKFLAESAPTTPQQITHKALSLIQFLETLYAIGDVFPVEILPSRPEDQGQKDSPQETKIRLRSRPDRDRDELARALKLKPPAIRIEELLTADRLKPDGWILSDSKSLGDRNPADTEWRFHDIERPRDEPNRYLFAGSTPPPVLRDALLIAEGSVGTDKQFKRRLKALRALKEHDELLRMMTDPRARIIESHDSFTEKPFEQLDNSKLEAIRELISTLPLYLVQGPPGVGKTRLVRDLVRQRFEEDPTSRLLLSAQSNAAINHLMDELEAVLIRTDAQSAPLIVRCGGRDGQEARSKFDIAVQSKALVRQLSASDLATRLPSKLQKALAILVAGAEGDLQGVENDDQPYAASVSGRAIPQAFRAFEGTVARAANVVFATTNSGELERLIQERGQCDWAIVEEAAKATGSELVSPMLLSHRRLMIGDHKQLSPFASDQLIELLNSPEDVRNALTLGAEFVGRSLRDSTTEDILDLLDDGMDETADDKPVEDDQFPHLCSEALRLLTFFETTIEMEFARQKTQHKGRPIARQLSEQHRMHPDIASLVSRCFYDRTLTSHPDCVNRFQEGLAPFGSTDVTRLSVTPLVVIDMPYTQAVLKGDYGDRMPRWHNPGEIRAVSKILSFSNVRPGLSEPPTLAILSPYLQQVKRLNEAVRELPILKQFRAPSHDGQFCHTVDSFQGSEADLVIVSLVRNNGHTNVRSALGFLSESRRMNVLLSRARWQLILVTSIPFLSEIVDAAKGSSSERTIQFIEEMLVALREGREGGGTSIVPFEQLMRHTK